MESLSLDRPEHLDDDSWRAVEEARGRVHFARQMGDLSEVVGKSKELVETVARVVILSTEGTANEKLDFQPTVTAAHRALERQPGVGLANNEPLRAIAQSARTLATSLAPLRNEFGTGHGRARVPDVVEETATLCVEAAFLWTKWALKRLGHLLADYPNDLMAAVQTGTTQRVLRAKFVAADLPQQPVEVQHLIGVSFGRQSAGGFFNATEVGVEPAIDGSLSAYPLAYRQGLLEGMLLAAEGRVGLTDSYAKWFVSLLAALPEEEANDTMSQLAAKVDGADWISTWRGDTEVKPESVLETLRREGLRLQEGHARAFKDLLRTQSDAAARSEPERD